VSPDCPFERLLFRLLGVVIPACLLKGLLYLLHHEVNPACPLEGKLPLLTSTPDCNQLLSPSLLFWWSSVFHAFSGIWFLQLLMYLQLKVRLFGRYWFLVVE